MYRLAHPSWTDPKRSRVFVVVSRQVLCDTVEYSTVICSPVSSSRHGLATQVPVGEEEGLKHASAVHCDGLVSLPKTALTDFMGSLGPQKLAALHVGIRMRNHNKGRGIGCRAYAVYERRSETGSANSRGPVAWRDG